MTSSCWFENLQPRGEYFTVWRATIFFFWLSWQYIYTHNGLQELTSNFKYHSTNVKRKQKFFFFFECNFLPGVLYTGLIYDIERRSHYLPQSLLNGKRFVFLNPSNFITFKLQFNLLPHSFIKWIFIVVFFTFIRHPQMRSKLF